MTRNQDRDATRQQGKDEGSKDTSKDMASWKPGSEAAEAKNVAGEQLKTEHSFYLAGQRFLTLHYEIERLVADSP